MRYMIKRTQFKIGTIKNLQSYISRKDSQRGFSKEKVGQKLLLLTEEVGELIKSCRSEFGVGVGKYSNERHKFRASSSC